MGANKLSGPSTRYDDPAPIGGSFIITCAKVTESTATMRAVRASEPALIEGAPHDEDRFPTLRQTVKGVCEEIIAVISESLKAKSPGDWTAYWRLNLEVFDNLTKSLHHFARELGLNRDKLRAIRDRNVAAQRFPEAEGELAFICGIVHDAHSQARRFDKMPVREDLRAKDLEAYGRYRYFGSLFGSCIVSLEYLSYHPDVEVQPDVLEAIFDTARSAALQFNHAVMEAARLREPPEEADQPAVESIVIPDDDLIDVEHAISKFEGQTEA